MYFTAHKTDTLKSYAYMQDNSVHEVQDQRDKDSTYSVTACRKATSLKNIQKTLATRAINIS